MLKLKKIVSSNYFGGILFRKKLLRITRNCRVTQLLLFLVRWEKWTYHLNSWGDHSKAEEEIPPFNYFEIFFV